MDTGHRRSMRGTWPASFEALSDVVAGPGKGTGGLRRSQAFTRTVIERAPMLQARLPRRSALSISEN